MNKSITLASLLLVWTTLTHAEKKDSKEVTAKAVPVAAENTIQISTRPEIAGLWGMVIPNNKKCVEYYNFRSGNEIVVNSGKEWSVGLYEYQPSVDAAENLLPTLVMQVNYENNELDCSGNQVDQSGEISQYFVKWETPNKINFCGSEKGDQCFATLNRVLP